MAAPANKTIGDLNGKWVMNAKLSDSPEAGLALQGIGYLTRKAIGFATVTLQIKQYTGPPTPPGKGSECTHVDIEQTATGGVKGTSERRCLDDTVREHSDWLFGKGAARSRFVSEGDDMAAVVARHGDFLAQGWKVDEAEKTGPGGASHIMASVEAEAGWTAVQIWGFELVGGERKYCRRVIIKKGDKSVQLHLVYDWISE